MNNGLDAQQLNFNSDSIWVLNLCLAIIMFGVALGLNVADFKRILQNPKPALVGILSQFLVLPALTYLLVLVTQPAPSIALGMIMVAACPGGNVSNFMSKLAGGNPALSVTLTAFSTGLCLFLTPFNLQFWGSLYEPTNVLLKEVSVDPIEVFQTVVVILGIPLILGMALNAWKPAFSGKLSKILTPISILIFAALVVIAFYNNVDIFLEFMHLVVFLVFLHNAIALSSGYALGSIWRLSVPDKKSLAIETGIQNSGLGLLLIFSFFNGLGGMAIVAGWWGIWHIISGLTIAYFWSRKKSVSLVQ
jgi:BASS family bile acid:Na+ symporter